MLTSISVYRVETPIHYSNPRGVIIVDVVIIIVPIPIVVIVICRLHNVIL